MVRIYSPTKRFTRNKPNLIFITSTCHLFIAIQFFIQKMFAHKKTDTFSGIYKEKDKDDKSDF